MSSFFWTRYLRRNATSWNELARFPDLRPEEQRKDMALRLQRQIRYFGNRDDALPEWKEAAKIEKAEDVLPIWPDLPVVTKDMLRTRFPAGEIGRRFRIEGTANCTGGSTGEPVHFFHDRAMLKSGIAAIAFSSIRMGWRPGMPIVVLWGSERDVKKRTTLRNRIHARLRNQFLIDGYHLSDHTVERMCKHLVRGPVVMYGFTSMLEFVARRILEKRLSIRPGVVRAAWNGGEMLFPEQIEVFRQAFGVPILNRYGGRELSVMACQFADGAPLHVFRPWLFLEVLDDRGRPASPGQMGRLVWTSTVCRGTPFIRYDVEDLGSFRPCDQNESGIVAIDTLYGRFGGVLELRGGQKINNLYWNHFFKDVKEVEQFQVILRKNRSLRILLRGAGFSPERESAVRGVLTNFLGDVPVQLQWVAQIPRTKEGKLIQVYKET
jgi:phenylacetate-CoA ligase